MSKQSRIAVVGSANVDLVTFSDRFPRAGETIFGDHFDLGWGGKGANRAVAARLCGAQVSMVARVGDDLFGPATISNFEAQGIDATHVRARAENDERALVFDFTRQWRPVEFHSRRSSPGVPDARSEAFTRSIRPAW